MIVINSRLARDAYANAVASGRVTETSTPRAVLLQSTVHLGHVYKAQSIPDTRMPLYSEQEFTAADTILWLLAYLQKLECDDIEQLLKDVAKFRAKHPDKPGDTWPS